MNIKQIIQHSHSFISASGFRYQFEDIANFFLSIKSKPFVILAGISGTGKTQLPRKLASSMGFKEEQVIQVAVRPDWADSSDLLGYTGLDGNFIPKDLSLAIKRAANNPSIPYFFILDEMNLARVEHYFSDFLSVIETRRWVGEEIITDPILRPETLYMAKNKDDFASLRWPQNLYLIGTVNMDETTYAFSRKVLDRANSIEMNNIDLSWIDATDTSIEPLTEISNAFFKTPYLNSTDLSVAQKDSIVKGMNLLIKVNEILKQADLQFA
ncbi:MAG: AAA family ATPase [Bacteroidales bacterium]|nr:AAA family ATPase [Bacteroidales bacterium]